MINKWFLLIASFITIQRPAFSKWVKEELFAPSSLISAKISPDGNSIAYIGADEGGICNLFIGSKEKLLTSHEQISFFNTPDIIQFFWSGDSKRVLLLKDEDGKGKLHLHGFNIDTKNQVVYTESFSNITTKVLQISSKKNQAIIGLNQRNPHFHDLYLLDLESGNLELFFENDQYAKFLISDNLDLILKMRINDKDGSWIILKANDELFVELTSQEAFQTEFLSYNEASDLVYLLDNRFSDTNQLVARSLSILDQQENLSSISISDVDDVLFIEGEPKAYAFYYEEKKWHPIDPSIEKDLLYLESQLGATFEVISCDRKGDTWIVSTSYPDQGTLFRLYDKKNQSLSLLQSASYELDSFSKMYPLIATARDGKKLVCYYTLPKELDKGGFVDRPIPLVVVPHGGPFKVRDKYRFNPYHQWLANCGYAVLSVNFRLSSGFGKAFVNAGNGEWGKKAHLDLIDAVEACIEKGITKKGKLAIFGGSYGGYESLVSLTFSPDYFTCAVAICGPSNLKTVLDSLPKFWELTSSPLSDATKFFTKQAFITSMGADPDSLEGIEYLQKCSPLNYLKAIQAPLLLVHGKNDHIVIEKESEQIYKSMKANNKKVTYILFPDEGHRFAKFANQMLYLDHAERFFSEHLGGSYSPINSDLLAHSKAQIYN